MPKIERYNKREMRIIERIAREIREELEKNNQLGKIFRMESDRRDSDWKDLFDRIAYPIFNEKMVHVGERGYFFNAAIRKIKEDIWSEQKERKDCKPEQTFLPFGKPR